MIANNNKHTNIASKVITDENTPNSKRNILPNTKKNAWSKNIKKQIANASTASSNSTTRNNRKSTNEDNVKVYVRIRPHSKDQSSLPIASSISAISKKEIHFDNGGDNNNNGVKKFSVDSVFNTTSTQNNIFVQVGKPVVDSALQGYNGTVLAYGQTGSGKTYTMLGSPAEPGLIPRVCQYLFSQIDNIQKNSNKVMKKKKKKQQVVENNNNNKSSLIDNKINVYVSYLEIYQENVLDLLDIESGKKDLREDTKKKCVYVDKLVEKEVISPKEAAEWMAIGNTNRKTGSTKMNNESSRSHAVFTLSLEIHSTNKKTGAQTKRTSKINLVDLAGSERQQNTGATGARLKEGATINKSLSALGNVIKSLVSKRNWHVAYRDSKLTFLLRDSLGGNAQTSMIAAVSPEISNRYESLSTLEFVKRAKCIKNKVVKNEDTIGTNEALRNQLKMLQQRNNELESEVLALKDAVDEDQEQETMQLKLKDALERANSAEMQLETLTLHHAMTNRRESSTSSTSVKNSNNNNDSNSDDNNSSTTESATMDNQNRDSLLFSPLCSTIYNKSSSNNCSSENDLALSDHEVQKLEWRQSIEALNIEFRRQSLVDGNSDPDGGIEGPLLTMQVQTLKQEIEEVTNELKECKEENIALNDHVNILEENAKLLEYKYDVKVKDMMNLVREKEEWMKHNNKAEALSKQIQNQTEIIHCLKQENENLVRDILNAKVNEMVHLVEETHVTKQENDDKIVIVNSKIYEQLHHLQMKNLGKEISKAKGISFLIKKMKKRRKKKSKYNAILAASKKLPTRVENKDITELAEAKELAPPKPPKTKKKPTTLKDMNIEFLNFNVLPECIDAKGKKLIYFVSKTLKLNGTATVEELENESVTMKKMYAKDVIDFLNNMENADKIEKESKDDSPDNKNQDAFTTFINENGKSVGNTSKQILRKSILKAFLQKFNFNDESLFKRIEKKFKRQTQVYDILTLSEKDMETLKFNEENKESLKLAQEDKEMKSFVEDIHRKEQEEEDRIKEEENKYNESVEKFTNKYNKTICDKFISAIDTKIATEGLEDTWTYYTTTLEKVLTLTETGAFEILKLAVNMNKLALGKAIVTFNKEENEEGVNTTIDINAKNDVGGSTIFHTACRNGNIRFVKFLFNEFHSSNNLNINAIDNDQTTPLMEAVYNDNVSVVKFLLEKGVETYHDDKDGNTALSFAEDKKHKRCIKLLERYEEEDTDESEEERLADELDDLMMGDNDDDDGEEMNHHVSGGENNNVDNEAKSETILAPVVPKRSNRPQRKARMSVVTYKEQVSDGESDDAWSASEMIEEEDEEDDSDYE